MYVGPSAIHGKGLFAACRIEKGEFIGTYEGKATRRNGPYVLWIEDDDGNYNGIHGTNELRFVNHHMKPNAQFENDALYAVCAIPAGCEITIHYGEDWETEIE